MVKYIGDIITLLLCVCFVGSCSKPQASPHVEQGYQILGSQDSESVENPFVATSEFKESAFSVDVDGGSYAYMRSVLSRRHLPPAKSVRLEEYLNYFAFDYPEPQADAAVSITGEIGTCPWAAGHKLVRLGIKGRTIPIDELPASNLVFMVDVSGSMNSVEKLPLIKSSLKAFVDKLRPQDRISIVTYSGNVDVALVSTPASEISVIKEVISDLHVEDSASDEDALTLSYEEALKKFVDGGNNRVIMCTDGDFNVGISDVNDIMAVVKKYLKKGVRMTVCGFGSDVYNTAMMEMLSKCGSGRYEYIDSESEFLKVFINERGEYYSVASDVETKVVFNPAFVSSWRLIGYDNRPQSQNIHSGALNTSAVIGSSQSVTALYEIVPADGFYPGCGAIDFSVKYKDISTDKNSDISTIVTEPNVSARMLPELDFAAGVVAYGMILMNSDYKGSATLEMAEKLVASGIPNDPFGYRLELLELIGKARTIKK